jgi:hypothetical protein
MAPKFHHVMWGSNSRKQVLADQPHAHYKAQTKSAFRCSLLHDGIIIFGQLKPEEVVMSQVEVRTF